MKITQHVNCIYQNHLRIPYEQRLDCRKNKLAWIWFSICSFLLSSGAVSCSCATRNFVVWLQDHTLKSTIHRLWWHVWKIFRHFRCVQEGSGTHSFGFPSVRWWGFWGSAWHKFSACPDPRSKFRGRFNDSNSTHYRSFWLSNVDQTSRQPSLWSHFRPFLTCKVFQN